MYDTFTTATLSTGSAAFTGRFGSDLLTVATSAGSFLDKNAASGKVVSISSLSLGGADAGNYTLAGTTASTTADITPASISGVTGITASNKTYDGNTSATLNTLGAGFTGRLGTDALIVAAATGTFSDKNAALVKTVNIAGLALGGADALNYTLGNTTATTTADIFQATINAISGVTAANKVYDGNTNATLNSAGAILSGKVAGDALTIGPGLVGTFSDKNAAVGKPVSVGGVTLTGADVANYTLGSLAVSAVADITPATLTVSGITSANKVYDTTTVAILNSGGAMLGGKVGGDSVSLIGATGAFVDKNVGVGKTVNVTGLSLTGIDASNYTLAGTTASTTADITPAGISTISGITAANKVYDGSTGAILDKSAAVFTGKLAGDALTVAGGTGAFTDKNAAVGKTVNITGLGLDGADALNYTLSSISASAVADIAPAGITAITGITAADKVYDTTTTATLNTGSAGFTGRIGADALTVATAAGSFVNKGAAAAKTVNITALTLGGADAANYTLTNPAATATATITPAPISAVTGIAAVDKVYDGSTTATLTTTSAAFTGRLGSDVLSVASGSGNFSDKNVGSPKTVNITGLTLSGTDALNYTLAGSTATATAAITQASISAVTGITASKVYDGDGSATAITAAAGFTGAVAGDSLSVAAASASYNDKNVNAIKPLTITGLSLGGADAGNYTLASTTASGSGSISQLSSVAWTGSALDNLWSSAGNWTGGAIPDGANVAAVVINSGSGDITHDVSGVGINSLSSTRRVVQSTGSFGTVSVPANLTISTSAGIALDNPANRIGTLNVSNTTSGDVSIQNTGVLHVAGLTNTGGGITLVNTGGITTTGMVRAALGNVSITANSPLTVGSAGVVADVGSVSLIANNSDGVLTLNGPVTAATSVDLFAGNTLTQNAPVQGGGAVTANALQAIAPYGPFATTNGAPISYMVNGVSVPAPTTGVFSQTQAIDTVVTFLDLFEAALEQQIVEESSGTNADGTRKKRVDDTIVTEGEVCR